MVLHSSFKQVADSIKPCAVETGRRGTTEASKTTIGELGFAGVVIGSELTGFESLDVPGMEYSWPIRPSKVT